MEEEKLMQMIADATAGPIQDEAEHATCDKRDAHQALRDANPSWERAEGCDERERPNSYTSG